MGVEKDSGGAGDAGTAAGAGRLGDYHRKRSFDRTPEPRGTASAGASDAEAASDAVAPARFVIQEHHARRLHWDLRLERDGALASWALPRGVPDDPAHNRLAVRTEDHPLDYLTFAGEIPAGEYGGGTMTIWDHGTYEAEKFRDDKVVVRLTGGRVRGRYALFRTHGDDWMMHRMDAPEDGTDPMPRSLTPMAATPSTLPADESDWGFEIKWDGVRAVAFGEPGRLRLVGRTGSDYTRRYPEIGGLSEQLGARRVVLDGEVVAFDDDGRPSFQRLQPRIHVSSDADVRQRRAEIPVMYVIFDLLYLDGRSLLGLSYQDRRRRLDELGLGGAHWQVPAYHQGEGRALLDATRTQGLEGVVAKRLGSRYRPGRRSRDWLKIKNTRRQEVVIGGWIAGQGRLSGGFGALLVGYHDDDGSLLYAGKVGTGFDRSERDQLQAALEPLRTSSSPFTGRQPQRDAVFVEPRLVCEVEFAEWTTAGTMRHPSYEGLRDDKDPAVVVREDPLPPPDATE